MQRIQVVILALLLPTPVLAAGFEFPDNGARALSRGGAFVASGDDPTLIQHNPAGLAGLDGFRVSLDGHFAWWSTEYQRLVAGEDGGWITDDPLTGEPMRPVSNEHGPWITPFLSFTYQVMDGLTLALGVYGPSAVGERQYPDPRELAPYFYDGVYEPGEEDSREVQQLIPRRAPQRYSMIRLFNLVAYPTLSVGWEPLPWLRVGASGQLVYSMMQYSLALRSDLVAAFAGDGPQADIIGELDVSTKTLGLTGVLGVQVKPIDHLTIGMTVRPGFTLEQEGTFTLYFNDYLADPDGMFGLSQGDDYAVFTTSMPTILRLGVAWEQGGWLGEVAASYERLSVVDDYILEPTISIESSLMDPIEVEDETILLEKSWRDTFGLRFGGGADLQQAFGLQVPLEVFAGYAFERGAIQSGTQNLDFISQNRSQVTTGVGYDLGSARITAAFSRTFEPTVEVRDSRVFMIDDAAFDPDPDATPEEQQAALTMVGDGDYRSAHTLFMLSVEGRFGTAGR